MLVFITLKVCVQSLPLPCLCKRIMWVGFFLCQGFGVFFSHFEELWALKAVALVLWHG